MLQVYLNFKDETSEVIKFYETVFDTKCEGIMTFGEAPVDPDRPIPASWKNLVMNASMKIEDTYIMLSDVPDGVGMNLIMGNNISLVISINDEARIERLYNQLAEDGKIIMPLEKTFWSKKFGSVIDKYGVGWMISHYDESQ